MKKAVCNEMFGTMDLNTVCDILAEKGFSGLEIAPFTIYRDSGYVSADVTRSVRNILDSHGLEFAGFHWLLAWPDFLHITDADRTVRKQSTHHLGELLKAAGDLGGGCLVFGSPKQREVIGIPVQEGLGYFIEELSELAGTAEENDSTICIEALPGKDTNIVNTLEEMSGIINHINRPGIQGMFDFHNCTDESDPWEKLVAEYFGYIRHVHVNTWEGGHPCEADVSRYLPSFRRLEGLGYDRWYSLEIFTVPEDPENVIQEIAAFYRDLEAAM